MAWDPSADPKGNELKSAAEAANAEFAQQLEAAKAQDLLRSPPVSWPGTRFQRPGRVDGLSPLSEEVEYETEEEAEAKRLVTLTEKINDLRADFGGKLATFYLEALLSSGALFISNQKQWLSTLDANKTPLSYWYLKLSSSQFFDGLVPSDWKAFDDTGDLKQKLEAKMESVIRNLSAYWGELGIDGQRFYVASLTQQLTPKWLSTSRIHFGSLLGDLDRETNYEDWSEKCSKANIVFPRDLEPINYDSWWVFFSRFFTLDKEVTYQKINEGDLKYLYDDMIQGVKNLKLPQNIKQLDPKDESAGLEESPQSTLLNEILPVLNSCFAIINGFQTTSSGSVLRSELSAEDIELVKVFFFCKSLLGLGFPNLEDLEQFEERLTQRYGIQCDGQLVLTTGADLRGIEFYDRSFFDAFPTGLSEDYRSMVVFKMSVKESADLNQSLIGGTADAASYVSGLNGSLVSGIYASGVV